jgi:hypothetical protein
LKGVPKKFQVELLEKYQSVTKKDVLAALRTHFLPLFDPSSSAAIVVTSPFKVDEIRQGLGSLGFDVEERTLDVDSDESDASAGDGSGSENDRESDYSSYEDSGR